MWVVKKVGESPKIREGSPSYEQIRGALGGYLECAYTLRPDSGGVIRIWADEEGVIKRLPHNMYGFVGTLVATAEDLEGETVAMTPSGAEAAVAWLAGEPKVRPSSEG